MPEIKTVTARVRVTEPGVYGGTLRSEGDEFVMTWPATVNRPDRNSRRADGSFDLKPVPYTPSWVEVLEQKKEPAKAATQPKPAAKAEG